jgi:hypothetical protein
MMVIIIIIMFAVALIDIAKARRKRLSLDNVDKKLRERSLFADEQRKVCFVVKCCHSLLNNNTSCSKSKKAKKSKKNKEKAADSSESESMSVVEDDADADNIDVDQGLHYFHHQHSLLMILIVVVVVVALDVSEPKEMVARDEAMYALGKGLLF